LYSIFYHRSVVYSLDKEQNSYDDLLDALRLGLKHLNLSRILIKNQGDNGISTPIWEK